MYSNLRTGFYKKVQRYSTSILHHQTGTIVRTLEYIIGRLNGTYLTADPIYFRRTKMRYNANSSRRSFSFIRLAHDVVDSRRSGDTIQKEANWLGKESYSKPTKTSSAEPEDSISVKLAEFKSLYNDVFSNSIGDDTLRRMKSDIILLQSSLDYHHKKQI
jgi:hypothetical protein